jgi:acyl-coenzyme A thioesterase PaaI-like protein
VKKILAKFLDLSSPGALINDNWRRLSKIPKGNVIFSKIIGWVIPYTGSISPLVQKIENGVAVVQLQDRRKIRNHLRCIHAIALSNLGEFTTGLSVISQLDNKANAILVRLEAIYLKKARGTLTAEAISIIHHPITQDEEFNVTANIKNLQQEIVCQIQTTWRVRPSSAGLQESSKR